MSKPIVRISQDLSANENVPPPAKTEERNGGQPDTQNDLKHDLMKVHDLLMETKTFGFQGVEYKTQKDAQGRLTVTISFPSPSEIAQMRAQQAAAAPTGTPMPASLTGGTPSPNVTQMPAGGSAAPAAAPAPEAKAAGTLARPKYADIQVLKTKYPNGFLKAMGI